MPHPKKETLVNLAVGVLVIATTCGGWVYAAGARSEQEAALHKDLEETKARVTAIEKRQADGRRERDLQYAAMDKQLSGISDKLDDLCDRMGVPRRRQAAMEEK